MTEETGTAASQSALAPGPLANLKVLDLSWVLAGPYCTMVLADLGADVIKCERPPFGDVARTTGPLVDGEAGYFFSVKRGKRSIAVDLKREAGKEPFLRLGREEGGGVESCGPGEVGGAAAGGCVGRNVAEINRQELGEAAGHRARPLQHNAYKIRLTAGLVGRAVETLIFDWR